jgi:LysM repeat protein
MAELEDDLPEENQNKPKNIAALLVSLLTLLTLIVVLLITGVFLLNLGKAVLSKEPRREMRTAASATPHAAVSTVLASPATSQPTAPTHTKSPTKTATPHPPTPTIPAPTSTKDPATATPLPTQSSRAGCKSPGGWTAYQVRPGDTLYELSKKSGVSIDQLACANCLGSPWLIIAGTTLYIPVSQ